MSNKQERYIAREQEYRKTIEEIEKDIEVHSTCPLRIIKEHNENDLLLQGIDPSSPEQLEQIERDKRLKANNEHINQVNVKAVHTNLADLHSQILKGHSSMAEVVLKHRDRTFAQMDQKLDEIKK